jgi:hypothetical protein
MTPRVGLNIRPGTRQINRGEERSGVGLWRGVDGVESRGVPGHECSTSNVWGKEELPYCISSLLGSCASSEEPERINSQTIGAFACTRLKGPGS